MKNSISGKQKFWFYIIAALIPFVFFILLELVLRIVNYGTDYSTFVKISDQFDDYLFFNPRLPEKYFSSNVPIPSVIPDAFKEVKPENGIRIFALGGSSTAGYPYPPNASFPRFLKRNLELLFPENEIEVINLGISAVNSFTMRDIIEDVIDQKPDLILIYAGHNEYYGAMGAASTQSYGNSKLLVDLILFLKKFKTYEFVSDILKSAADLFSPENKTPDPDKTLMGSMIDENHIALNSDPYFSGINSFETNIRYVLEACRDNKINVAIGTLAANLRQFPLGKSDRNRNSKNSFDEAVKLLEKNKFDEAKEMFIKAKDEDGLRFRAPSAINDIIQKLSAEFNLFPVRIDSAFSAQSEFGITGFNLMVDHLHPVIKGYKLIGDLFLDNIVKNRQLPVKNYPDSAKLHFVDILSRQVFPFSSLDTSYSNFSIKILLNSFPFSEKSNIAGLLQSLALNDISDTLALKIIKHEISWENAHLVLAEQYFREGKYLNYFNEMNVLIDDKPFEKTNYQHAVNKLIRAGQFELAHRFLLRNLKRSPDGFTFKNLGIVYSETKNYTRAIDHLENAKKLFPSDAELYFRLSQAYFFTNDFTAAFDNIKKCISINPDYPNARTIYETLKNK